MAFVLFTKEQTIYMYVCMYVLVCVIDDWDDRKVWTEREPITNYKTHSFKFRNSNKK